MRNTFLKTIGTMTLAILMLAVFAQIPVSAQDAIIEEKSDPQTEGIFFPPSRSRGTFEGTWDVQLTIRNCQTGAAIRTIPEIVTFMFGGTMINSTTGVPPALKTPGHGIWRHLGGRNYLFKFKFFSFDASGNLTGWTIITQEADLNTSATAYTSAGIAEVYNAMGNLVFTGCSTTTATRFE